MILTVCCNPCIDKYLYVEDLALSKLNRIIETYACIGGKGINVAKAITVLGMKAYATGFMGEEDEARIKRELDEIGITSDFTLFPGAVRTNFKLIDRKDGTVTELNENGAVISDKTANSLLALITKVSKKCNFAVLSGSLPKGVNDNFYARIASALNIPFAVDAEKSKLLQTLPYQPAIIKPNLFELEDLCGKRLYGNAEIISACRELVEKGAKRVLLSMGAEGALLVTESNAFIARSPEIKIESTVGAGDTMLSAAVVSIIQKESERDILRAAVAAGSAACTTKGTDVITKECFDSLYASVKAEDF